MSVDAVDGRVASMLGRDVTCSRRVMTMKRDDESATAECTGLASNSMHHENESVTKTQPGLRRAVMSLDEDSAPRVWLKKWIGL